MNGCFFLMQIKSIFDFMLLCFRITPRKYDVIQASELGQKVGTITADVRDLTLKRRETRTSFTFRKVRRSSCNCSKCLEVLFHSKFLFLYHQFFEQSSLSL